MPTLKSREFEIPDELGLAYIHLKETRDDMIQQCNDLFRMTRSISDDACNAIITDAAELLEYHIESITKFDAEMMKFLQSFN